MGRPRKKTKTTVPPEDRVLLSHTCDHCKAWFQSNGVNLAVYLFDVCVSKDPETAKLTQFYVRLGSCASYTSTQE